jgi:hypothetical protein
MGAVTQQPLPPAGFLHVHLQGSALTGNVITPRVRLNGHPVPTRYGENVYPVPPGPWRIEVDAQWMRTYGQAQLDVQVGVDQHVQVFYAAPLHQFTRGAIGFEKQKRPGVLGSLLILVVLLLVLGVPLTWAIVA